MTSSVREGVDTPPAHATLGDTVRVAAKVALPTIAAGVIKRRPSVMSRAERFQLDRASIASLRRLRARYGERLLRLRVPGRSIVLPLTGDEVGTVLERTPEPFTPASKEKRAALKKFQPHGALISAGGVRAQRRNFNEMLLETHRPLHQLADPIAATVAEECGRLVDETVAGGVLTWDTFDATWWRIVRRIVFGDAARDDESLITTLETLRRSANWAYLGRSRPNTRRRLARRMREHLERAEPGSLAALINEAPAGPKAEPYDQVAHWLFAFDAAGMASLRTLALLATHPEQSKQARHELTDLDLRTPHHLPYLRSCVLESVRLWPTSPALLREAGNDTRWNGATLPAGTTFLIFTPFFHRDSERLSYADRFAPLIWLDGRARENPALVPFSDGPAACPGRNLVLFITSMTLAHLLDGCDVRLVSANRVDPTRPLPATLDNFSLRFAAAAAAGTFASRTGRS